MPWRDSRLCGSRLFLLTWQNKLIYTQEGPNKTGNENREVFMISVLLNWCTKKLTEATMESSLGHNTMEPLRTGQDDIFQQHISSDAASLLPQRIFCLVEVTSLNVILTNCNSMWPVLFSPSDRECVCERGSESRTWSWRRGLQQRLPQVVFSTFAGYCKFICLWTDFVTALAPQLNYKMNDELKSGCDHRK